ncbi:MAG: diphosphomevalonate decarboxylase [Myxococcaceae bacterium]|nr:diphosphomevalonate decarboxylase [Myxococcaceae bacterium]
MKATARAHPNIALVKYWGKRDEALILPHQSSLSLTLAPLAITTTVEFGVPGDDFVSINGVFAKGKPRDRVLGVIERLRAANASLGSARVDSQGDFPVSAGLASSAAAFAALAVAAQKAAGLALDTQAASILARLGSGSACRSIQGGVCVWNRGERVDGADSFASQAFKAEHWPELRMTVAVIGRDEKEVSSRDGMRHTVETSPYYSAWVRDAEAEVKTALAAIAVRDFETLGQIAERNAWRMHATAFAACPPVNYMLPGTLRVIDGLRSLRADGVPAYFTLDAGPNPVVLHLAKHASQVHEWLVEQGADTVVACHIGGDAQLIG